MPRNTVLRCGFVASSSRHGMDADLLEHVPRDRQQRGPGRGERDVVGAAVEQLLPELVLEVLDPLAQRRGGHVQFPRGGGEVQLLGDRDEVAQVQQFHTHTLGRVLQASSAIVAAEGHGGGTAETPEYTRGGTASAPLTRDSHRTDSQDTAWAFWITPS